MIKVKRIYDPPSSRDGRRFLVDRLWPRGVKRDALSLDDWLKDVGPSDAMRRQRGSIFRSGPDCHVMQIVQQ